MAIFCFPILLKVDYMVGVFNKLNLLFGAGCMFYMHYYRFSHGGKVCSGDYIMSGYEVNTNIYLLERGELFWWYIVTFWSVIGLICAIGVGITIATLRSLS